MDELFDFFNQAMADNRLTRSEAQALRECLKTENPGYRELNTLRARIFKAVAEKQNAQNYAELHEWLEEAVKLIVQRLKPGREIISRCHFSPGDACRDAVIEKVSTATHRVRICVFTISDNLIAKALKSAHRRGVKIEIISDNDKMEDAGSDIRELSRAGIPVFIDTTPHHMHHKFAVIDDTWLLTGSFNWTRSATVYNQENILITNDPSAVVAYNTAFDRLLPEMARLG